jgi:prepilin-type N-terminal cleavage/methylation domain-containing protein/prepilin-type processing-associated H-X9-DG protein
MLTQSPSMKKSAFTLIELLVVITIIAILAGIALPVFAKAMEKGRVAQDASNLRQLGIGTVAYLTDNNDQIFPSATSGTTASYWPQLLFAKYVTNWNTYKSPFDPRGFQSAPDAAADNVPVSYGINTYVLNGTSANPPFDGNTTRYISPSLLFYMAPCYIGLPTTASNWAGLGSTSPTVTSTGPTQGTHSGNAFINVLYPDGHVASIRFANTGGFTDSSSTTGLTNWQPLNPITTN